MPVGAEYKKATHSTMQNRCYDKWVLCNYNVSKYSTYNYLENYGIDRFECSGNQEIILSRFISLEGIKYFVIDKQGDHIIIRDFLTKKETVYQCNLPVFYGCKITKKGIYFEAKINSQYLYILKSTIVREKLSLLDCESMYIRALTSINNTRNLCVKSQNEQIDLFVNNTLPDRIISRFLQFPDGELNSFLAFANLDFSRINIFDNGLLSRDVKLYFWYLKTYYGIDISSSGIYCTNNCDKLLQSKITFKKNDQKYAFEVVKNDYNNALCSGYKGDFSGRNFISFKDISAPISLQI